MYAPVGPELLERELENLLKEVPSKDRPEVERIARGTVNAAGKCNIRDTFFRVSDVINLADRKKISSRLRDTVMRLVESVIGRSCGCRMTR